MTTCLLRSCVCLLVFCSLHATAVADPITLVGDGSTSTEGIGSFSAVLTYSSTSASSATLNVVLTNTAAPSAGFVTAFAFNNPGGKITDVTLQTTSNLALLGGPAFNNGINAQPFGHFDIGAATGGSFQGGGTPTPGIESGEDATFVFQLTGTMLDMLTEDDFANTVSVNASTEFGPQVFVVRFRGGEESDKVASNGAPPAPPSAPPTPIPEPTSLAIWALLVFGGLGCGFRRWQCICRRPVGAG